MSLQDYRQLWSGDDLIPTGGYGALVTQHGADVPVRHATTVMRLDWSGSGVIAETSGGNIAARTAVVTVPVGVLKAGSLRFTPDLPIDIQRALDGLHMGALTKIAMRVDATALAAAGSTDLFDSDPNGAQLSFELWPEKGTRPATQPGAIMPAACAKPESLPPSTMQRNGSPGCSGKISARR